MRESCGDELCMVGLSGQSRATGAQLLRDACQPNCSADQTLW
jgi:hypothetical protein